MYLILALILVNFKVKLFYLSLLFCFSLSLNILGQYTLHAAKMGHQVISIEPFYENIIRIHKASFLENTKDKIMLINNALSNKRNEIKMLQEDHKNVGGQGLLENKDKVFTREDLKSNKFLVETILLDDIIEYIPTNKQKQINKKAIIKIDIQGFEAFAFQGAKKLFATFEFQMIFMEWVMLPPQVESHQIITEMIDLIYAHGLKPYDGEKLLVKENWLKWSYDVLWKRDGL